MGIAGCAADPRPYPELGPAPSRGRADSDWEDLDAAVEVGTGQSECVVVRRATEPGGLERRYELRHVSGKEGVLVARIEPGRRDPQPIELACSMGPLGDGAIEGKIVRRVARRLDDLRGHEVAPIRE